jgi:hypothetical protein
MIFNWYKIFNLADFLALGLVSKSYTVTLEDVGDEDFLVVKANMNSVVFRDVLLPIQFNGDNPTVREGDDGTYAVYVKPNQDVYVGIELEDS